MNTAFRKNLPGTQLDYYDAREAVDAIKPGAYAKLPYTARVHAENLVRKGEPEKINAYLGQLIEHGETERIFTNPSNPQTEGYITGRFG